MDTRKINSTLKEEKPNYDGSASWDKFFYNTIDEKIKNAKSIIDLYEIVDSATMEIGYQQKKGFWKFTTPMMIKLEKAKGFGYLNMIHAGEDFINSSHLYFNKNATKAGFLEGLIAGGHLATEQKSLHTLANIRDNNLRNFIVNQANSELRRYHPRVNFIYPDMSKLLLQAKAMQYIFSHHTIPKVYEEPKSYEQVKTHGEIVANLKDFSNHKTLIREKAYDNGFLHMRYQKHETNKDKRAKDLGNLCLKDETPKEVYNTLAKEWHKFFDSTNKKDKKYVEVIEQQIRKLHL
ncbi:MAG: hypothetical protein H0W64_10940 [Gammaproteobacteria bacterium]|nr:hypothetical protein [Gammaproteobacteria bacterium]